MDAHDLFTLRETYNAQRIMLCFNGPFSRSLIEEIGNALRNYLEREKAQPSAATDVFAAYIEMTQNIRHYSDVHAYGDADADATVVIARDPDGRHIVSAGNVVETADGEALMQRIAQLNALDKAGRKTLYKEQLRAPREASSKSGAGLGFIDIARKSTAPMQAALRTLREGRAFFSLRVVI